MALNRARWLVLPVAFAGAVACGNGGGQSGSAGPSGSGSAAVTAASAASQAATSSAAPSGAPGQGDREQRGGEGRWGAAGMLFRAARDLDLKDDQKLTLEKIQRDLRAADAGPRTEFKDLHADLVAQIRSGKMDAAKLAPRYEAIDKVMQARRDQEVAALDALYAMLEPAQRKAAVAAVRAKQAEREAHAAEHKPDTKADDADWAKRRLEHLTKDLDLDAAQQKSVQAVLAKADHPTAATKEARKEEMKKQMDALLSAFEADGFDAKKLELSPSGGKKAREPMEAEVKLLSQLVPLLTPAQREKLALAVEQRVRHMNGQPGGRGGQSGYGPLLEDGHDEAPGKGHDPAPGK
jgi:Spy/CpxP family protein refolding chaperone